MAILLNILKKNKYKFNNAQTSDILQKSPSYFKTSKEVIVKSKFALK